MRIIKLTGFQKQRLAELKSMWKKNWLKIIGFTFLVQASFEYFANHMFGCSLTAALLLGYAMYYCGKKNKQAELAHDDNMAWSYFTTMVIATVFCGLMFFLAVVAMPLSVQTWLNLPPTQWSAPANTKGGICK